MRRYLLTTVVFCCCILAFSQATAPDKALLAKSRALYDAPYTRGLVSFDCAVQFDWKQHFVNVLGTVPPTAVPTIEHLQAVQHRVFVDRSGATVSDIPKAPDFSGAEHAAEFDQMLNEIVSSGVNAWLPFSTNVILPVGPTKYDFQKMTPGYKLTLNGEGVSATLLLSEDMRITSGVSQLPQPMKFATEFINGPNGYLLESMKTSPVIRTETDSEVTFAYTYQAVKNFQLPDHLTVSKSSAPETWYFALTDCKVMTGTVINVAPPSELKTKD